MEPIKCFLLEPILGIPLSEPHNGWPPYQSITGWRRSDTGEEHEFQREFGPGAMWFATWMPKNFWWENETEPHLVVHCPTGRDWDIDSQCSNCGKPKDYLHRCWVRHGIAPNITVDKGRGAETDETCNAGAGSISLPGWHGFLKGGFLIEA